MKQQLLFAFLFTVLTTGGFAQKYDKIFNDEFVPSDLKKKGHILLIVGPYKSKQVNKNEEFKKIIDSTYKGKFVLVTAGITDSPEYSDKTIYKYQVTILPSYDGPHLWYNAGITDRSKAKDDYTSCGIREAERKFEKFVTYLFEKLNEARE